MADVRQHDEPALAELTIADDPEHWRSVGFDVRSGGFDVGEVTVTCTERDGEGGIVSWALHHTRAGDLDGLVTNIAQALPVGTSHHDNGVTRIDHVVVVTPSLDRTAAALDDAGIRLRRERRGGTPDAPQRQGFFRVGEAILEVVAPASDEPGAAGPAGPMSAGDPARFWGVVFVVPDLDELAALLGERLGPARPAVQPGRRIATLRREAGLAVPVAFITPQPARDS